MENLMGVIQVFVQFICYSLILVLYIFYFPRDRRYIRLMQSNDEVWTIEFKIAIAVGVIGLGYLLIVVALGGVLLMSVGKADESEYTELYANSLGLFSMTVAVLQFMPQMIKTYRSGKVGALSIPMMALQAPGSFLFVYTLAVRPGNNFTTWITYLCTGILQAILLAMCIVFAIREKRQRRMTDLEERQRLNASRESDEAGLVFVKKASASSAGSVSTNASSVSIGEIRITNNRLDELPGSVSERTRRDDVVNVKVIDDDF
jgi:uncharacterized protein with PQ loop repeat